MTEEQDYESSDLMFESENQSLSDDKLIDIRFEEEEEDELTRKIKAIPILPRIPKIKKTNSACDEESTKRVLEHRSVLHRKELFMNTEDTLKWPTSETQTYDRHRKRTFNSYPEKKTTRDRTNDSFQQRNGGITSINSDRRRINGRSFSTNLTAEEKFDRLRSNKESETNPTSETISIPDPNNHTSEHEKTSNEFDNFENSLLNDSTPMKPYKTLEERRQERIRKGLLQSSTEASVSKAEAETSESANDKPSKDLHSATSNGKRTTNGGNHHQELPNSSKEIGTVDGSTSSSDVDSQTEVVDMEIADSPCEATNGDASTAKMKTSSNRKVTFHCPESNNSKKVSNASSKKDHKKRQSDHSKKANCQEQVVSIMKDFLKPFYSKQKISKDDYKEIMRKIVPKFSKSRKEEVKKDKIERYAEKYVKALLHKKNKP